MLVGFSSVLQNISLLFFLFAVFLKRSWVQFFLTPLYVRCFFFPLPLVYFKIFSFLNFLQFEYVMSRCRFFGTYSAWYSLNFLNLQFPPLILENSQSLLFQIFLPFISLFPFLLFPIMCMLQLLELCHSYWIFCSIFFIFPPHYITVLEVSMDISSSSLILSSVMPSLHAFYEPITCVHFWW